MLDLIYENTKLGSFGFRSVSDCMEEFTYHKRADKLFYIRRERRTQLDE